MMDTSSLFIALLLVLMRPALLSSHKLVNVDVPVAIPVPGFKFSIKTIKTKGYWFFMVKAQ
ncbi:hypothetical protein; putative exported protein [Marinobacter nauticus ATCC 49840]|nr:hypothetical protein; putative exported protein [Marinobacter nauticus ATCC 49840]